MDVWFMILALLNIILLLISLFLFVPKETWRKSLGDYTSMFLSQWIPLALIFAVVILHLIEVNIIDAPLTQTIGVNFTPTIQSIEDGAVHWFSQHWNLMLVYFFVLIYIGLYPFLLWFSVLYFIITDERKAMRIFAYSLVIIYAIALPFYLFVPITNVYQYYGISSALNMVIPTVEHFFYTTTTTNNCFPSLHVAMSVLLAATMSHTKNKRFIYFTYFCATCVICSVIYLAVHWITDVIGGILLSTGVFSLVRHTMKER